MRKGLLDGVYDEAKEVGTTPYLVLKKRINYHDLGYNYGRPCQMCVHCRKVKFPAGEVYCCVIIGIVYEPDAIINPLGTCAQQVQGFEVK